MNILQNKIGFELGKQKLYLNLYPISNEVEASNTHATVSQVGKHLYY